MMASEKESNKEEGEEEEVVVEGWRGEVREKWDIPAEHLREADLISRRDLSRAEAALFIFSPLSVFPDAAPSHSGHSEGLSAEITAAAAALIPSPRGE